MIKGKVFIRMVSKIKICIVAASGGHLTHMYMLKPVWEKYDHFWVSYDREDTKSIIGGDNMYKCHYPSNSNPISVIHNTWIAIRTLFKERPNVIISSGASVAVPFFYIGKLFGEKLIYVEVFDRIDKPTLTGKLVYPITDKFIVQWDEQLKVYPKAINLGSIF